MSKRVNSPLFLSLLLLVNTTHCHMVPCMHQLCISEGGQRCMGRGERLQQVLPYTHSPFSSITLIFLFLSLPLSSCSSPPTCQLYFSVSPIIDTPKSITDTLPLTVRWMQAMSLGCATPAGSLRERRGGEKHKVNRERNKLEKKMWSGEEKKMEKQKGSTTNKTKITSSWTKMHTRTSSCAVICSRYHGGSFVSSFLLCLSACEWIIARNKHQITWTRCTNTYARGSHTHTLCTYRWLVIAVMDASFDFDSNSNKVVVVWEAQCGVRVAVHAQLER